MTGNKVSLRLRIRKAGATVREGNFEQESLILGSGDGAAVRLEDPRVSNLHLMLKVETGGVTAIDLGSEHGTRVGNELIRQPVPLRPGDVIQLGNFEIEVSFGDASRGDPPLMDFSSGLEQPPSPSVLASAPRPRGTFSPSVAAAVAPAVDRAVDPAVAPALLPPKLNKVTRLRPAPHIVPAPRVRAATSARRLLQGPLPRESRPLPSDHALQVSHLWGDRLLAVEHFGEGVEVRVGEGKKNAFPIYAAGVGKSHVLATSHHGKLRLHVPEDADFEILSNGAPVPQEALRASGMRRRGVGQKLELALDDSAQVRFGSTVLFLRHVKPSPRVNVHQLEKGEERFAVAALAMIFLVAGLVTVFALSPVTEPTFEGQSSRAKTEYIGFLIKSRNAKAHAKAPKVVHEAGAKEGPKSQGDEGKIGKEEAKQEQAAPSRHGTPVTNPRAHEVDRTKVMRSGLLGAVTSNAASDVFGPGGLGTGMNKALGGIRGTSLGDAHGVGGLGTRGMGKGAGGAGLGIGGLGTKGMGPGKGGYGAVDLGGKGHEITRIIPGKTRVVGGLSREVIERVIRQHQSEIKYCYEIELNQRPDLAGKVGVAFTIDGGGAVSDASVSESTLHDGTTEQCMISKIRRWKFPQPLGGGTVSVNFPWIFKPAG